MALLYQIPGRTDEEALDRYLSPTATSAVPPETAAVHKSLLTKQKILHELGKSAHELETMEAARYQLLIQADVQPAYRLLILWQWTATGKRPATADPDTLIAWQVKYYCSKHFQVGTALHQCVLNPRVARAICDAVNNIKVDRQAASSTFYHTYLEHLFYYLAVHHPEVAGSNNMHQRIRESYVAICDRLANHKEHTTYSFIKPSPQDAPDTKQLEGRLDNDLSQPNVNHLETVHQFLQRQFFPAIPGLTVLDALQLLLRVAAKHPRDFAI